MCHSLSPPGQPVFEQCVTLGAPALQQQEISTLSALLMNNSPSETMCDSTGDTLPPLKGKQLGLGFSLTWLKSLSLKCRNILMFPAASALDTGAAVAQKL